MVKISEKTRDVGKRIKSIAQKLYKPAELSPQEKLLKAIEQYSRETQEINVEGVGKRLAKGMTQLLETYDEQTTNPLKERLSAIEKKINEISIIYSRPVSETMKEFTKTYLQAVKEGAVHQAKEYLKTNEGQREIRDLVISSLKEQAKTYTRRMISVTGIALLSLMALIGYNLHLRYRTTTGVVSSRVDSLAEKIERVEKNQLSQKNITEDLENKIATLKTDLNNFNTRFDMMKTETSASLEQQKSELQLTITEITTSLKQLKELYNALKTSADSNLQLSEAKFLNFEVKIKNIEDKLKVYEEIIKSAKTEKAEEVKEAEPELIESAEEVEKTKETEIKPETTELIKKAEESLISQPPTNQ